MFNSRRRELLAETHAQYEAEYLEVLAAARPYLAMLDNLRDGGEAAVDLAWARQAAAVIDRAAWRVGKLVQQTSSSQPSARARQALEARCQREQAELLDAQARALRLGAWFTVESQANAMELLPQAESALYEQWKTEWVGPAGFARMNLRRLPG